GALTLAEAVARLAGGSAGAIAGPGVVVRDRDDAVEGTALRVEEGLLAGLAQAWAGGAEVDWAAYFGDERRGRVPLPTYPFEGRRCWLAAPEDADQGGARGALHPMLDANVSTLARVAYRSERSGAEFYLADHRVDGEPVMPAVAYLELARAAGELALGQPVELRDVSFTRVLGFAGGERAMTIVLDPVDGGADFEVEVEGQPYASGELHPAGADAREPTPLATPLAGEGAGWTELSHAECYATLAACGLDYGPRMRALAELKVGEREAVGRLELPDGGALGGQTVLEPALLDGALHALVVLLARVYGEARSCLPLTVGKLEVFAPVVGSCRVHVRVVDRGARTARASFELIGPDRQVCARGSELVVRVGERAARAGLFVRRWQPCAPADGPARVPLAGVVLASSPARREALAAVLRDQGVSVVSQVVDPSELASAPPLVLVDEPDVETLLRLAQRLVELGISAAKRIVVLHRHDALGPSSDRAALGAFARTLREENPKLHMQVVGLGPEVDEREALAVELGHGDEEIELRYADAGRTAPRLVPAPAAQPAPLREGGVYLISGAGALARLVERWLLGRVDARMVLLSRSAVDLDAEPGLSHRRVDVGDAAAVAAVVAKLRAELGPIRGVFHTAGVLRDGFALTKALADLRAVAAPKIAGLAALRTATAADELDFLVSFSSIAAHVGSAGQTDYAYANAWLEAEAERSPGLRTIAWPMWAEGGMRQTAEAAADIAARSGFAVVPTSVGLELLEGALGGDGAVLAAYGDLDRIVDQVPARAKPKAGERGRVEGAAKRSLEAAALELLRELLAKATGLAPEELDAEASFERLGIDSLMITKLNRELDRRFTGLSKTLFFEYANLAELAEYFATDHGAELERGASPATVAPVAASARRQAPAPARPARRRRTSAAAEGGLGERGAVAIIGVAGRYPEADDLDAFWANLRDGRDCITDIPAQRWDHGRWYDADPATLGRAHTRWGGFLSHVDRFDPLFFGISPRHAELMDPQERLFLQTAWHAIEDAGYRRSALAGQPVGVYVGVMYGEYQFHGALDLLRGGRPLTSSSFATIANRVSYALDLTGPSFALDTMCSSSLTAIHLACESLRRGETSLAIAGGVNVSIHPYKYAFLSQGRFLSSDGRCRSFGEGGDGYVPGEGVGAVLLKPYAQARADGDRILGLIRGSALNHGGRTNGYTVPSPRAQTRVIETAMDEAGLAPADIDYVEAHGTGTSLGDPIEIAGLSRAYGHGAEPEPRQWAIGSVKSNVGHLESAAGIAGLTKVLLQLRHEALAPSLHAAELNPNIDFQRVPFVVQRELGAWARGARTRRAGLSSFGAGGSNAHLVIEEAPEPELDADRPAAEQRVDEPVLFVLSARDEDRLRAYARAAADFVEVARVPLDALCYTLQIGREPLERRLAILTRAGSELVSVLRRYAAGGELPELVGGGELGDAGRRWLDEAEVDWAAHHAGAGLRRVRAPLYPFAEERYWIPFDADLGPASLHPLIDANESTVAQLRFRKTLWPDDSLVRDHVIEGQPLVAGAATLELARAAVELADPGRAYALREVVWARPIVVLGAERTIYAGIVPAGDRLAFELYSEAEGGRVTHARGQAVAVQHEVERPAAVQLAAVQARATWTRAGAAVAADYVSAGFAYGPSFDVISSPNPLSASA
ncbi:beta-ketoacyl synthase N-terminal-like domain-containing protein, partial [Enhygromyxa salina]|uniref:beta-ketoacyl synthase N-terminal-like domain-containing protein n=1 Tax=Enhygromyxa salina TaxID=215803 RepID=UPI0011BADACE